MRKIRILYIGNKLYKKGNNPTSVDVLGELFEQVFVIKSISDKRSRFLRMIHITWILLTRLRNIDYVLVDTYSTLNFYYALVTSILCRIKKTPYLPYLHGGSLPRRLTNSRKLSKLVFANSFVNVAPSHYLKREFEKKGYKCELIPNVIDIGQYDFKHRTVLRPKILFVRAFHRIYNPTMAIKAFAFVQKEYPEAEMCMVGPAKDETSNQSQVLANEPGVERSVKMVGKLTKTEWTNLSRDYDVFVNPTDFDNTPVSVIEAMALGLPVVSTNAGGLKDLIKNNVDGVLVDTGDENNMANSILALLHDPVQASNISSNGRLKAESFDWEKVKNSWIELLT